MSELKKFEDIWAREINKGFFVGYVEEFLKDFGDIIKKEDIVNHLCWHSIDDYKSRIKEMKSLYKEIESLGNKKTDEFNKILKGEVGMDISGVKKRLDKLDRIESVMNDNYDYDEDF